MLKYLKTMQPGEHVAIYTLLKSLRIVQDFTDDPQRLVRAASKAGAQQFRCLWPIRISRP